MKTVEFVSKLVSPTPKFQIRYLSHDTGEKASFLPKAQDPSCKTAGS